MQVGLRFLTITSLLLAAGPTAFGEEQRGAAERGYHWLVNKGYVRPTLDNELFDNIWRVWPEPLRSQAESASRLRRRKMAFARYGLTPRPENVGKPQAYELPLQYVVDRQGHWTVNCFSCHGGQVAGRVVPGLPNSRLALQTLAEEVLATKVALKRTLGAEDLGLLFMPLSKTNGTTNAVMFGVVLLAARDAELNIHRQRSLPKLTHHDMDAPPWWHFRKREMLYVDGFAPKGHRALMQFMLGIENDAQHFRDTEQDYRDIFQYMESLEPPAYSYAVDRPLAERGEMLFQRHCADCHGTYGERETYPGRMIPIAEVGTDPVRLDGLTVANREHYANSWFAEGHRADVLTAPAGYVAPPLDGIWASAPYLHNGSVPTLWHLMHPADRPAVWRRTATGYDTRRVGLEVEEFESMPATDSSKEAREFFDTGRFGMSAEGHDFPDVLNRDQKRAVLEYLKTL